ncbi:hypothetical protein J6590_013508 [Homalodisca vitripennis]|nr:hypothetical protein J6590_013508 [Homalodisca vitripennis]
MDRMGRRELLMDIVYPGWYINVAILANSGPVSCFRQPHPPPPLSSPFSLLPFGLIPTVKSTTLTIQFKLSEYYRTSTSARIQISIGANGLGALVTSFLVTETTLRVP